eukprot:Pgem_evm2s1559
MIKGRLNGETEEKKELIDRMNGWMGSFCLKGSNRKDACVEIEPNLTNITMIKKKNNARKLLDEYKLKEKGALIDLDKLDLPDRKPACDLMKWLPPDMVNLYNQPSLEILQGVPEPPEEPYIGVLPGQYNVLVDKLEKVGMVNLIPVGEDSYLDTHIVINGCFAQTKQKTGRQRFILAATNCNKYWRDSPKVELVDPSLFSHLVMEKGSQLVIGKTDIKSMYNNIIIPKWWRRFFGLERVFKNGKWYNVVMVCMPMGFTLAVLLAIALLVVLMQRSGLHPNLEIFHLTSPISFSYIDDSMIIEVINKNEKREDTTITATIEKIRQMSEEMKLPLSESKIVDTSTAETKDPVVSMLGSELSSKGILRVEEEKIDRLAQINLAIIERGNVEIGVLCSIIGKWTNLILIHRLIFSTLDHIYRLITSYESKPKNTVVVLNSKVTKELQALVLWAPFLETDLTRPLNTIVWATDASNNGIGVVKSTDFSKAEILELYSLSERKGCYTFLNKTQETIKNHTPKLKNLLKDKNWDLVARVRATEALHINEDFGATVYSKLQNNLSIHGVIPSAGR